jgi:hypothetical protein
MLAFVNASTNQVEAPAKKPWWMSAQRFAKIETACREGRGYDVAKAMLYIIDTQPHPDCFLLPR